MSKGDSGGKDDKDAKRRKREEQRRKNEETWRKFRQRPRWQQIVTWASLAAIAVVIGVVAATSGGGSTPTAGTNPPPTLAPLPSPETTTEQPPAPEDTTASPLAPSTIEQWRERYGQDVTFVIASAHGLSQAIDAGNEVHVMASCSALGDNYRRLPHGDSPPGMDALWEQALDAAYTAQRDCHSGVFRRSDLASARVNAEQTVRLLNEILGDGN